MKKFGAGTGVNVTDHLARQYADGRRGDVLRLLAACLRSPQNMADAKTQNLFRYFPTANHLLSLSGTKSAATVLEYGASICAGLFQIFL